MNRFKKILVAVVGNGPSCRVKNRIRSGIILLLITSTLTSTGCRTFSAPPPAPPQLAHGRIEFSHGGIIRGAKDRKAVALSFTGHQFAEGADTILNELQKHHAKASFFLTGDFIANPDFHPIIRRLAAEGHYFSVHSDKHLLYCSWNQERTTLITREQFEADLRANVEHFNKLELKQPVGRFFIPPYEHYNQEITDWATQAGFTLINYTPGTRSHADYTGEADKNFTSSQVILDSIVKREVTDPHGLNGFILLLHLGSGPGRADKFHLRFGELLDHLTVKGYALVRVDELLAPAK